MKKIIILFLIFAFIIPSCFAFYIGVPGTISVEKVLSGRYAEKLVKINGDNELPLRIRLSSAGIIRDWIGFEPERFYLDETGTYTFKMIIKPPENIIKGIYEGFIIIDALPISENEITSSVSSSANIKLKIEITDEEITQANVDYIEVKDIIKGKPVDFSITIENKGNSQINPEIKTEILDKNKSVIVSSAGSKNMGIAPLSIETIHNSIPNNLDFGSYWLHLTVSIDDKWLLYEQTSGFTVYESSIPEKEPELEEIISFTPVKLGASPFIIVFWILIVVFIAWKIHSNKKANKK